LTPLRVGRSFAVRNVITTLNNITKIASQIFGVGVY